VTFSVEVVEAGYVGLVVTGAHPSNLGHRVVVWPRTRSILES
jgi:hypothetical protein